MSRYCECENSEYWLTVELKTGEMEALKGNAVRSTSLTAT